MNLNYQVSGEGRPLVILHGLFGMLDNLSPLARQFSQSFRVFAVDLRNHGRSPHSDEMSLESMAGDIRDFCRAQSIESLSVIGHSLGGKVAMQSALLFPELVERIVIVDIAPRAYTPQHTELIEAMMSLDLAQYSQRQEVDEALSSPIKEPVIRQFLLKNLGRDDAGRFRWKMNLSAIARNYSLLNAWPATKRSFDGAALFIRGTRSDYIQPTDETGIRQMFSRAEIVEINAGHWVHADEPAEFLRVTSEWLRERE